MKKFHWLIIVVIAFCLGLLVWLFYELPSIENLERNRPVASIQILDRKGELIYEVLPRETGRHRGVRLSDIPTDLKYATIATEDNRFYEHHGVDLLGVARSLFVNIKNGRIVLGASTIPQQVVRNLLMEPDERQERSVKRKVREAYLAWRLTLRYSKDEILALYLNNIYYGNLAYGIDAAAHTYFNKSVGDLDLAECALLAGLAQAPEYYNPLITPERAKERQSVVLGLMEKHGYLGQEKRLMAEREPLRYSSEPYPSKALHFALWIRSQLPGLLSPEQLADPMGLKVYTTIDLSWQYLAEQAIRTQIEALQHSKEGINHQVNNMALVALDPETGAVLSMVGSPDYFDDLHGGAINMALAPRQPGSALKPIVYAAALDPKQEKPWTAATMLLDVRTNFVTRDGYAYIPSNYDNLEHGPVLVRQALGSSLNIPAILTMEHIGLDRFIELAGELGISTFTNPDQYDLSLALGGGDVSLLELTSAYGAFANEGYRVEPYAIEKIVNGAGEMVYTHTVNQPLRVLDERVAWLVSDILSDDQARVIGFGLNSTLRIDRPAAVKTGTTSNYHDNWTIGYTPDLVVGVWAGNTDQTPMVNVTGLTGAGPVWHNFIRSALQEYQPRPFIRPEGMVQLEICAFSGMLPTDDCEYRKKEWFITGTEPVQPDSIVRLIGFDRVTGLPATGQTLAENWIPTLILDLPPSAGAWAKAHGYYLLSSLPNSVGSEQEKKIPVISESELALEILTPANRNVYYISNQYPREIQQVAVRIAVHGSISALKVFIDGDALELIDLENHETWWQLEEGSHVLWVEGISDDGELIKSDMIQFEVKSEK